MNLKENLSIQFNQSQFVTLFSLRLWPSFVIAILLILLWLCYTYTMWIYCVYNIPNEFPQSQPSAVSQKNRRNINKNMEKKNIILPWVETYESVWRSTYIRLYCTPIVDVDMLKRKKFFWCITENHFHFNEFSLFRLLIATSPH